MKDVTITDSIFYIGADDKDIRLFESQYEVPNGMAYNSYLIKDEKNVVFDTSDMKVSFKHKFAKKPEVIDGNMKALEMALKEVKKI